VSAERQNSLISRDGWSVVTRLQKSKHISTATRSRDMAALTCNRRTCHICICSDIRKQQRNCGNGSFLLGLCRDWGHAVVCSWLSFYAISWKVMGSIPDDITGFFNWPNPYSRTMTLGSTQPLIQKTIRKLSGSKEKPAHKADNLTAICELTVCKMWEPRHLTALWDSMHSFTSFLLCRGHIWRIKTQASQ
jgi:hypothetical protein